MIHLYTEDQLIASVTRLTQTRLTAYVGQAYLCPAQSEDGLVYSPADLARAELICDLVEQFNLQDDALGVVLSLIDQLHGVRGELQRVMDAIDRQPSAIQAEIQAILAQEK